MIVEADFEKFVNKTILDIKVVNENYIIIYFTDSTKLRVYADSPVGDYNTSLIISE